MFKILWFDFLKKRNFCKFTNCHTGKQISQKDRDRYAVDQEITDSLEIIPIQIKIPIIVPTLVLFLCIGIQKCTFQKLKIYTWWLLVTLTYCDVQNVFSIKCSKRTLKIYNLQWHWPGFDLQWCLKMLSVSLKLRGGGQASPRASSTSFQKYFWAPMHGKHNFTGHNGRSKSDQDYPKVFKYKF